MTRVELVLENHPRSGAANMALDEALLEDAVAGNAPVLRWYQWDEATLSLGYFQDPLECQHDPRWSNLPVVRRLSGGGAILHHHEWTYSCALPSSHPLTADAYQIYISLHQALIQVLCRWGYAARLRSHTFGKDGPAEAFLCFSRGDAMDVVIGQHKIIGSAQRRRKGAVLQHGSLILRRSELAPEFPGLFDFQPCQTESALHRELALAAATVLGDECVETSIRPDIQQAAQHLLDDRYSRLDWGRRNPLSTSQSLTPGSEG